MTTGRALLDMARGMAPQSFARTFGYDPADDIHNVTDRPALIATLMTQLRPSDLQLVRRLTRYEMDRVRVEGHETPQTLLACCWLLFRGGDVTDALQVWAAKGLRFETSCMIDSALLAPRGANATLALADSLGFVDLASHVRVQAGPEFDDDIAHWRRGTYCGRIPDASAPREDLADWIAH